jgi:hypothetical protein
MMLLTTMISSSVVVHFGYSQEAAATPNEISVLSSSSFTDDIGAYHIVGEVSNQGSQKATFVKVSSIL